MPSDVCLVPNLVKEQTTLAALGEVSAPPASLLLDRLLLEGSSSYLVSGPLLPSGVIKFIGNLRIVMLPGVLKGMLSFCDVVILSSLLVKVGMGVCRNLERGLVTVVGSGVEASNGVGSSRICSAGCSSGPVCTNLSGLAGEVYPIS